MPPRPNTPTDTHMSDMQMEKGMVVRSHSEKNLSSALQKTERWVKDVENARQARDNVGGGVASRLSDLRMYSLSAWSQLTTRQDCPPGQFSPTLSFAQEIDGVYLRQRASISPPAPAPPQPASPPAGPRPYVVVGADSQPLNLQHGALTRKFYSRTEPSLTIGQYLVRLHQFCPFSTGVYLAASLYIHRLAVVERVIPVTRRNAHRLVLAGLRVASKALEDRTYPLAKVAKVGGVGAVELARLEISFCFLAGFELAVGEELLRGQLLF